MITATLTNGRRRLATGFSLHTAQFAPQIRDTSILSSCMQQRQSGSSREWPEFAVADHRADLPAFSHVSVLLSTITMSSDEGDNSLEPIVPQKKRRIQRACDICRQKRRACESRKSKNFESESSESIGVQAMDYEALTGSVLIASRTGQKTTKLTAEKERNTSSSSPDAPTTGEWSKNSPILQHSKNGSSSSNTSPSSNSPSSQAAIDDAPIKMAAMLLRNLNDREGAEDDESVTMELMKRIQGMKISTHGESFLGKSSGALLVKTALELKEEYTSSTSAAADAPYSSDIETQEKHGGWKNRRKDGKPTPPAPATPSPQPPSSPPSPRSTSTTATPSPHSSTARPSNSPSPTTSTCATKRWAQSF
ncbi:hypothetical protein R3P38DRAFT_3354694 [Favolaschia claudopus]|uniref:Uncharacterized protein n=1 Tax=Favolaschia claudopus TaxID=2862362 RepID=A0AAW0BNQ5_9AGAR